MLRADRPADKLFSRTRDYYAVVQYTATVTEGGGSGGAYMTDQEVTAAYNSWYTSTYPNKSVPTLAVPAESADGDTLLAWYAEAYALEDFRTWYESDDDDAAGRPMPTPAQLRDTIDSNYDEEYDDYDEVVRDEVADYIGTYIAYCDPYRFDIATQRAIVSMLNGGGQAPVSRTEVRTVAHLLTDGEKGAGLTVDADFFHDCAPLTVTPVETGATYDAQTGMQKPVYARTQAFFRVGGVTVPAFICDETAEEDEDAEGVAGDDRAAAAYYSKALFGDDVSDALTGDVPLSADCLVARGSYLVTSAYDAAGDYAGSGRTPRLDWEHVTVTAAGGSVDFTAADRSFVKLTVREDGMDAADMNMLTVELTGGDLGTARCDVSLLSYALDPDTYAMTATAVPMEVKAGAYGALNVTVGAAVTDSDSAVFFWRRTIDAPVEEDAYFTVPARSGVASGCTAALAFTAIDDGGAGPFTAGSDLRCEMVLTAGDYRLLGACGIHLDKDAAAQGREEGLVLTMLTTTASYEGGGAIASPANNFVWIFLNAPDESRTVNAVSSVKSDGVIDLRFTASGLLNVGAGGVAPRTPAGLTADAANTAVTFQWTANTEADLAGYRLYRSDSTGWDRKPIGTYTANTAAVDIDRSGWGAAPWYFVLSAVDTDGNESEPCAPVRVNDPRDRFHGQGDWTAASGEVKDGAFRLGADGGAMTFTFTPDTDVAQADLPATVTVTLHYRDMDDKAAEKTVTLARSDSYTSTMAVPADAAVLERADFTVPDRTEPVSTVLFRDMPLVGMLRVLLPGAADYPLAAEFDAAALKDGATSYPLSRSGDAFTGTVPRTSVRVAALEFRIGAEPFPLSGKLSAQTLTDDGFAIAASALPDKLRLRAAVPDMELPVVLSAWLESDDNRRSMAPVGAAVTGEDRYDFYVERPAKLQDWDTVHFTLLTAEGTYGYVPDQGAEYLAEEGTPFLRGGDLRLGGDIRALGVTEYMYLDVQSADNLALPGADLILTAKDADTGAEYRTMWYRRTKQLDTSALTAGKAYDLYTDTGSRYVAEAPVRITAVTDGSNRAAMPVLRLMHVMEVELRLLMYTDAMGVDSMAGRKPVTADCDVYYKNKITNAWTPLPGEWSADTASLYYSSNDGSPMIYRSQPVPYPYVDSDSGLRLAFGAQGHLVATYTMPNSSRVFYTEGAAFRLRSGQVYYTVPTAGQSGDGLTATGLISAIATNPDGARWELCDRDPIYHTTAVPARLEGLKAAQTPHLDLRFARTVMPDTLNLVLRNTVTGALHAYSYELLYDNEPKTRTYSFSDLPYGAYDLLLFTGEGGARSQLERQFSAGEDVAVPADVCGCIAKGLVLTETDAAISLDMPAEPVSADMPGIQSITVTPDKDTVLPGDRLTYTVRLSCAPGGSESQRTLDLDANYRSSFVIDSVNASVTRANGARVSAAADTDKVVLPADSSVLTAVVLVSGRVAEDSGSYPILDVAQGRVDRSGGHYVRGSSTPVRFSCFVTPRTLNHQVAANGMGAGNSTVTARITSRTDASRTCSQSISVSRYGYWRTMLTLPTGSGSDTFDVTFLDSQGHILDSAVVAYESKGVLPRKITLRWMFQDTQNRVVAYPGDNGDFEVLNKAVLTFASGYENTAVQVDLEFDDTDPDAWGLTDARRVKEPVLRVRPKGSSFSYEYDFLAADSRTFHLTANDVGVQQEGVPYSTRWFTRFCAGSYGRMTVDYDLLPDRDAIAVQALANSVAFNGSDALAADLKTFNSSLQNRGEVTSYTGTLDARLPQFRFDGLRVGDAEGYTPAQGESDDDFLLPPWTGTASYHASQTLTMTPLQEGQVAAEIDRLRQEDSTSSRILSGTDSCLRYGGCTDEVFFRCSDEGQLELVFRTEWNTLVDTSRLPDGDRTPQLAALLSRVPGTPDEGTGPIFGLKLSTEQAVGGGMLDAATNGAKYLVENGKLFATNAEAAKLVKLRANQIGGAVNVVSVGLTMVDEAEQYEKSRAEMAKLLDELYQKLNKSYAYYCGRLTCEEGGASAVVAQMDAVFAQAQKEFADVSQKSEWGNAALGAWNVGVSCTGFIEVPGAGTVINYLNDQNKELARENQKFFDDTAAWQAYYRAETGFRKAFSRYDPDACEKHEPDPVDLTDWLAVRKKNYTTVDEGQVSMDPPRVIDPSGVVYEGMLSNPLSGVTVTIEYQDGDTWKPWVEAPDYNDQQTSYVTDGSGFYRWDVPDGKWRVKYEKAGYNDDAAVYSDEMDVPPVWLDVNQNMTSDAPFTAEARQTETGVALRFTKPVQDGDVTAGVKLLRDGVATDAVFAAESTENGLAARYAAVCTLDDGANYSVRVENVRSYAGTACAFTVPVVASPAADPTACAPVKADIASGSTVAPGQTVTLSCATSGAAIWYTTDGSCPCVESNPARRAYTGPIAVTENSYLIAYATADGLKDSATAPFIYFCAAPEQTVTGRVSADSHSVTAAVWVDLTELDGYCDVLIACYSGERYVGAMMERAIKADDRSSVSVAKRLTTAQTLTDVTVRVMVLRTDAWSPLTPAVTLLP